MAPLVPVPSARVELSYTLSPSHTTCTIDAGGPPDGAAGARPHCAYHLNHNNRHMRTGSSGWRHWCPSPLRYKLGHCTGGPTDGAAGARPPRAISCLRLQACKT